MREDFNLFAPFYDSDFGNYEEDIDLYVNFAHRVGDPVLEAGCGTGRVLLPLARAGHHVTGVDIAAAMLRRARARVREAGLENRVSLIQSDVKYLALKRTFALILYAANSFMHHSTQEEQLGVLERLRDHLRPDGLLIIDLFNPTMETLLAADGRVELVKAWPGEESGTVIMKFQSAVHSPTAQTIDVTYIYDVVHEDKRLERTVAPFRLRYLWPGEARLLIERAGLKLEAMYGSYDLDPVDDAAPRLILVIRR